MLCWLYKIRHKVTKNRHVESVERSEGKVVFFPTSTEFDELSIDTNHVQERDQFDDLSRVEP